MDEEMMIRETMLVPRQEALELGEGGEPRESLREGKEVSTKESELGEGRKGWIVKMSGTCDKRNKIQEKEERQFVCESWRTNRG